MTCPVFPRSLVKNPNSSLPGSQDVSYNSFTGLLGNTRYNYNKYKTDQSTYEDRTLFRNSQFLFMQTYAPKIWAFITFYFTLFTRDTKTSEKPLGYLKTVTFEMYCLIKDCYDWRAHQTIGQRLNEQVKKLLRRHQSQHCYFCTYNIIGYAHTMKLVLVHSYS